MPAAAGVLPRDLQVGGGAAPGRAVLVACCSAVPGTALAWSAVAVAIAFAVAVDVPLRRDRTAGPRHRRSRYGHHHDGGDDNEEASEPDDDDQEELHGPVRADAQRHVPAERDGVLRSAG